MNFNLIGQFSRNGIQGFSHSFLSPWNTKIKRILSYANIKVMTKKSLSEDTICGRLSLDLLDIEDESFDLKQYAAVYYDGHHSTNTEERNTSHGKTYRM